MAEAVARWLEQEIGGVNSVRLAQGSKVVENLRTADFEQRPHDAVATQRNARGPAQARATPEAMEDGLRLIGARVARGQAVGGSREQRVQRGVAPRAQRRLRGLRHTNGERVEWEAEGARKRSDERDVVSAFWARAVIDARDLETEPEPRTQGVQGAQERDGVGPAADGDDHARATRDELMALDGLEDALDEAIHRAARRTRRANGALGRDDGAR